MDQIPNISKKEKKRERKGDRKREREGLRDREKRDEEVCNCKSQIVTNFCTTIHDENIQ